MCGFNKKTDDRTRYQEICLLDKEHHRWSATNPKKGENLDQGFYSSLLSDAVINAMTKSNLEADRLSS